MAASRDGVRVGDVEAAKGIAGVTLLPDRRVDRGPEAAIHGPQARGSPHLGALARPRFPGHRSAAPGPAYGAGVGVGAGVGCGAAAGAAAVSSGSTPKLALATSALPPTTVALSAGLE